MVVQMIIDVSQLEFIDKKLRSILLWSEKTIGLSFTITSLYRMGDNGVHGSLPLRGTDLRMRDMVVGKVIEKHINENWSYDPKRPDMQCAILHGKGCTFTSMCRCIQIQGVGDYSIVNK